MEDNVECIDYNGKNIIAIHVHVFDRNTHREGLTVAGLMMFGKGLPVRDRFDNIRMDYIDKTNLEADSRWSDRLTYDGTWENNLFNFFMRVIAKLTQDLKRPFKLEGMERIDDTPIHKAVREALTNMIIHADLLITGVLKIEKYEKEFLFSNPGSLKLPMEDIMHGGNSKARNPRIQNMLRMIGYGENIGSGYPTILKTWKEQNWRKPILIDRTELRQVDLTLPMVSLLPASTLAEMKAYYGEDTYNSFTANEQQVMAYVWKGDSVSKMELQQMLGMNSLEIGKLLHNMVDKNLLNQESKNRWTTYTINKKITPENGSEVKSEVKSDNRSLTNAENDALNLIKQNPHITYAEIGEKLSLGETSVYKILKRLREKKIIHRKSGRVYGYWGINNSESTE